MEGPFDNRKGLVAAWHSVTQHGGAIAAIPRSGTNRRRVYDVIAVTGSQGSADWQSQEETGLEYTYLGARRRELVRDGLVWQSNKTRLNPNTGAQQVIWRAD